MCTHFCHNLKVLGLHTAFLHNDQQFARLILLLYYTLAGHEPANAPYQELYTPFACRSSAEYTIFQTYGQFDSVHLLGLFSKKSTKAACLR